MRYKETPKQAAKRIKFKPVTDLFKDFPNKIRDKQVIKEHHPEVETLILEAIKDNIMGEDSLYYWIC
jgi:hypothetical protein